MEMQHFVNIDSLRRDDICVGKGSRNRNDSAFWRGDIISVTEKIDGSNASLRYNPDTGEFDAFSRKLPIYADDETPMVAFLNYAKTLNAADYADTPNYVIFGEWLRQHRIIYHPECMLKRYVYSIYDTNIQNWVTPDVVKEFCKTHNLEYVHELYYGPFISWDHCMSFMNQPFYGDAQEGVVVRNVSALERNDRSSHILKLVNDEYKETKDIQKIDPTKAASYEHTLDLIEFIVTKNRVEKIMLSLSEEGLIPENPTLDDISLIKKYVTSSVYRDCEKEEPEILYHCGKSAGNLCAGLTMKYIYDILKEKEN